MTVYETLDALALCALIGAKALKPLLGVVASGYAGADFIENSFSRLLPKPGATSATGNTGGGAAMSGASLLNANGCLLFADGWQITRLAQKVNSGGVGADQRLACSNAMLKHLGGQ